ncbi:MAG: S-layer homology domain-containing protein [Leptolyngbya sp. SIOISBB]|nr:S-layer homology domain-containing protein [Leptolyngbya sp. SIOISBB]
MPPPSHSPYSSSRRSSRRQRLVWLPFLVILGTLGGAVGGGVAIWGGSFSGPLTLGPVELSPSSTELDIASDRTTSVPQTTPHRSAETDSLVVPEPKVPDSLATGRLQPVRSPLVFTDVADGYWAKPYIDALTARGVLDGLPDGSFAPDRFLSRAELATQVANAFDMAATNPRKAFNDLSADYWATEPIDRAVMMGFMTGYPDDDFRPEAQVSRLQVLVTLATGLALPETTESQRQLQQYQDWEVVPTWAQSQIGAVMQAGIVSPSPAAQNRLRPQDPATRAEVTALVYAALVYLGEVGAVPE